MEIRESLEAWPSWMLEAGTEIDSSLSCISEIYLRLAHSVADGFTYKNVSDIQKNALLDLMIKEKVVSEEGTVLKHGVYADKEIHLLQLHTAGGALRKLDYLINSKTMTLVQYINASHYCFSTANVQVAFMCLRSIIEHVATFNTIMEEIDKCNVPSTFDEACNQLKEIENQISRRLYGTRVNWTALITGNVDELLNSGKGAVAYDPSAARHDLTAEQILKSVDNLAKKVIGIRALYEVLCEFAHPNVGALMSIVESSNHVKDQSGTVWIETKIGLGPPTFISRDLTNLLREILSRVTACLQHFEKLLEMSQEQRCTVINTSQIILRNLLMVKGLVDPYAPCPCGSRLKTKFCCLKSH